MNQIFLSDINKIIDDDIYKFLDLINEKYLYFHKLELSLQSICDKLNKNKNKNNIISFDIEFISFIIKKTDDDNDKLKFSEKTYNGKKSIKTINEMGGLILSRHDNEWYFIAFFHFNLLPICNNSNLFLLSSEYATVSDETLKKIRNYEIKLLPHEQFDVEYFNFLKKLNNIELFNEVKKNKLIKLFLNNKKIMNLIKTDDYDVFIKKLKKIKYNINGILLLNNKMMDEYNIFKNINNLILNDDLTKNRLIKKNDQIIFMNLMANIFSNNIMIVKGIEDFKAIYNHLIFYDIKYDYENKLYYDVAQHNQEIFNLCNSAELAKSYNCMKNKNKTIMYNTYYNSLKKNIKIKAHNPLVDSLFTWIIFNIFYSN